MRGEGKNRKTKERRHRGSLKRGEEQEREGLKHYVKAREEVF